MLITQLYREFLEVKSDKELEVLMEAIMVEMAELDEYRELLVA